MIREENITKILFDAVEKDKKSEVKTLPTYALTYNKLKALFSTDKELIIEPINDDDKSVIIRSVNYHKLVALSKMLKNPCNELNIKLICTGLDNEYAQTIQDAFSGNSHLKEVRIAEEATTGTKHVLTTFKDETIQYGADSRFVPNGYETTLAENLVTELFNDDYLQSVYITEQKTHNTVHMLGSTVDFNLSPRVLSSNINNGASITLSPGTEIKVGKN